MKYFLKFGLISFAVVALGIIFLNVNGISDLKTAILCTALSVLMLYPALRNRFKIYEPYSIILILFLHGFILQMAMMFFQTEKQIWEIILNIQEDSKIFQWGLICYFVALSSFLIGYFNKGLWRQKCVKLQNEAKEFNLKRIFWIVSILSFGSFICLLFFTSVIPEFGWFDSKTFVGKRFLEPVQENPWNYRGHIFQPNYNIYKTANVLSAVSMYLGIAFYKHIVQKKLLLSFIVLAILSNILLSIIISDRSGILTTALTIVIILYIQNEGFNLSRLYAVTITVAIILGIGMTTYRVEEGMPISDVLNRTFFWTDFLDIKRSSYIIDAVPEKIDYLYGESLIGWMALPIKRSSWENKPIYLEQSHIISQVVFENKGRAGVYPGLISELYWNFHIVGVILGFFSLGLLSNWMFRLLVFTKKNPVIVVTYSLFLTHLLFFSCSHSLGMGILKFALVFVPIFLLYQFYLTIKNN